MELGLEKKTAIVTGGGSGLGLAICEAFCQEKANVVMNYLVDQETVQELAARLRGKYRVQCIPCYGDISSAPDIERVLAQAEERLGGVDLLVNNAGIWTA